MNRFWNFSSFGSSVVIQPMISRYRKKRVTAPFAGLNAPQCFALREGLPAVSINVQEREGRLCKFNSVLIGSDVKSVDVRRTVLKDLKDTELLVAGFPCPPFARGGAGGGWEDPDAQLFYTTVDQCHELDTRGCYQGTVLENTWAITEARDGREAPLVEMNRYWKLKMPGHTPLTPWPMIGF